MRTLVHDPAVDAGPRFIDVPEPRPGSEVVARPAADGSGPLRGTRVTSFGPGGAWAGLRPAAVLEIG